MSMVHVVLSAAGFRAVLRMVCHVKQGSRMQFRMTAMIGKAVRCK